MVRRSRLTGFLGVTALVAAGIAGWQAYERDRAAGRIAVLEVELREAERQLGDQDAAPVGTAEKMAELEANLAAARQRLTVAETAVREAEDQLAGEIAKRVALETKLSVMGEQVSAAEAKAEKAVRELAKVEAVLPASRLAPRDLAVQSGEGDAVKAPETTASIGDADGTSVENGDEASSVVTAPPETPATAVGDDVETNAAAAPTAKPKRRVMRRSTAKPKKPAQKQYFLDSLFN